MQNLRWHSGKIGKGREMSRTFDIVILLLIVGMLYYDYTIIKDHNTQAHKPVSVQFKPTDCKCEPCETSKPAYCLPSIKYLEDELRDCHKNVEKLKSEIVDFIEQEAIYENSIDSLTDQISNSDWSFF